MAKQETKKTEKKSKLPTKRYILIRDVIIRKVLRKKGYKVDLTEEGRQYFQSKFYIE